MRGHGRSGVIASSEVLKREARILASETLSCEQESLDDVRDAAQLLQNARAKAPASMKLRIEAAQWLERMPRGETPLVIHRAPVQELLRRQGVEPSATR